MQSHICKSHVHLSQSHGTFGHDKAGIDLLCLIPLYILILLFQNPSHESYRPCMLYCPLLLSLTRPQDADMASRKHIPLAHPKSQSLYSYLLVFKENQTEGD
jgi:hypothetical protein